MAQRTAFLNSDAKGFNKDFHHTWIENYMIKQPGVLFSNYSTKPEFALGNGQIAGGKAIIRCTRTTGTFAGEEILASFESTTTENISTSGNKKIYIEIPEVYVNDSTAITDTLTQGVNLGVGRIVSSSDYPTHSNYIPLWEVTGGDWQNATDLRPEVLRRGKPNTISYFGGNGEEERIDIDNASLNKYLMSNGAGVAPSWEEGGGGGGGGAVENFKRTFTADETLLAKSMFGVEVQGGLSDVDSSIAFGKTTATKVFFPIVINGEDFSSIVLNLKAVNSPSDSLSVRIETLDANGQPSGTLVDVGAYGTVSPTGTATDTTINLSGTVTGLTAHTKAAVVLERSGTTSDSNYYELGCVSGAKVISQMYVNNGTTYSAVSYSGCVSCDGFANEAIVQATSSNGVEWTGYCETGATAGNDFTGILQGTVDYTGANTGTKYYLSSTGVLDTSGSLLVGYGVEDGVLKIESGTTINGEYGALSLKTVNSQSLVGSGNIQINGQITYDAVVAADGSGDYITIGAAVNDGKKNIFVKNGSYTENTGWDANISGNTTLHIVGESEGGVQISVPSTATASSNNIFIRTLQTSSIQSDFFMKNLTFTITTPSNFTKFYDDNAYNKNLFRIENCTFNYSTSSSNFVLFNTQAMSITEYVLDKVSGNGFFNCTFYSTATTKDAKILPGEGYFEGCMLTTPTDSGYLTIGGYSQDMVLNNCYIDCFGLGLPDGKYSNTYIRVRAGGSLNQGTNFTISSFDDGVFTVGALASRPNNFIVYGANNSRISCSDDVNITVKLSSSNNKNGIFGSNIIAKTIVMSTHNISSSNLYSEGTISTDSSGVKITSTTIYCNGAITIANDNCIIIGNAITCNSFVLSGNTNIVIGNTSVSANISNTGTGNVVANNT